MSEMVERVARALAVQQGFRSWQEMTESGKADLRVEARAAIAAMREPTVEMLSGFSIAGREVSRKVWHEMVDEALR